MLTRDHASLPKLSLLSREQLTIISAAASKGKKTKQTLMNWMMNSVWSILQEQALAQIVAAKRKSRRQSPRILDKKGIVTSLKSYTTVMVSYMVA